MLWVPVRVSIMVILRGEVLGTRLSTRLLLIVSIMILGLTLVVCSRCKWDGEVEVRTRCTSVTSVSVSDGYVRNLKEGRRR